MPWGDTEQGGAQKCPQKQSLQIKQPCLLGSLIPQGPQTSETLILPYPPSLRWRSVRLHVTSSWKIWIADYFLTLSALCKRSPWKLSVGSMYLRYIQAQSRIWKQKNRTPQPTGWDHYLHNEAVAAIWTRVSPSIICLSRSVATWSYRSKRQPWRATAEHILSAGHCRSSLGEQI